MKELLLLRFRSHIWAVDSEEYALFDAEGSREDNPFLQIP